MRNLRLLDRYRRTDKQVLRHYGGAGDHECGAFLVPSPIDGQLMIPVYFKGELYSVPVLMRYRLADGKLMFMIKVDRPDYIEQAAFDATAKQIAEATGIEPYIGAMA